MNMIRHFRQDVLRMTQKELSDKIGVSANCISKWERGRAAPSANHMFALSKALNAEISQLFPEGHV